MVDHSSKLERPRFPKCLGVRHRISSVANPHATAGRVSCENCQAHAHGQYNCNRVPGCRQIPASPIDVPKLC